MKILSLVLLFLAISANSWSHGNVVVDLKCSHKNSARSFEITLTKDAMLDLKYVFMKRLYGRSQRAHWMNDGMVYYQEKNDKGSVINYGFSIDNIANEEMFFELNAINKRSLNSPYILSAKTIEADLELNKKEFYCR